MLNNFNQDLPPGALSVWGCSAVITTTTAVPIIAGVAGRRLYIQQLVVTNKTAAELPVILIADDTGNAIVYLAPGDLSVTHDGSSIIWTPPQPIKLAVLADGITGETTAATTGDTHVFAQGFTILE